MCFTMSDVRLSNASPTLERVDLRQPDSVRPVRRCLFGSPDPEELKEQRQAARAEQEQRFRDTYNYDLREDTPLPGRYQWQEWKDAPDFYRRPPHRRPQERSLREAPGTHRDPAGTHREPPETHRDPTETHQDIPETQPEEMRQDAPGTEDEAPAERSRKRPSDPSGSSCSSEPQSKSCRTHGPEDQDQEQEQEQEEDHGSRTEEQVLEQAAGDQ